MVDVSKLSIPIGVILPFLEFPVALQTVVLFVEDLRDPHIADRMSLAAEFARERPRALANPPQG